MHRNFSINGIAILTICIVLAGTVEGVAQDDASQWNRMYLVLIGGQVNNAATFNSMGEYQSVKALSEMEYGFGLGITFSERLDCDLVYTTMGTSAAQTSGTSQDYMATSLNSRKLSGTLHSRFPCQCRCIIPWLGGGLDINNVSLTEEENLSAPQGEYTAYRTTRMTTMMGAHASAGILLYPVQQSAVALTAEARYTAYMANNVLDVNIDGLSFFAGLRWDFW